MAEEIKEVKEGPKPASEESKETKKACCTDGSHSTKVILIVVGIVIILGGIGAIAKIGFSRHEDRARFGSFKMMRGGGFGRQMMGRQSQFGEVNGLAVSGTITAISGDQLTIKTSGKDQVVDITDSTSIIKNQAIAAKGDLKVGDKVKAAGTSNSAGELVATLIRVQPS